MQSHLFHLYLTSPLFGEHVLFHRLVGDMLVQDYSLPAATLSLVYCARADSYRILLLADTRTASVCMPLTPRQLEGLIMDENGRSNQFPVYFLIRGMHGVEVVSGSIRLDELVPTASGRGLLSIESVGASLQG
jgi:hypothetical protein